MVYRHKVPYKGEQTQILRYRDSQKPAVPQPTQIGQDRIEISQDIPKLLSVAVDLTARAIQRRPDLTDSLVS